MLNPSVCQNCPDFAYLVNPPPTNYCLCMPNYGREVYSSMCVPCNKKCATCFQENKDQCTSCHDKTVGTSCDCLPKFYFDNSTSLCKDCHITCATCFGPNYNQCNSCTLGITIDRGVCGCQTGKYLDSNYQCQLCDTSCLSCVGAPKACTSCSTNQILQSGKCVCPLNQFMILSGTCYSCNPSCLTCSGSSQSTCTSCPPAVSYIQNGNCLCADGAFMNGATCTPCDAACQTCSGSSSNCKSCKTGLVLKGSHLYL